MPASPLEDLVAGLRGAPAPKSDWPAVIALANHTLLTPALFAALERSGAIGGLPEDVGGYLRFIHDCNQDRNRRLGAQLAEVVAAFNRQGIVPLLLKGAVPLFLAEGDRLPSRMTSDLDMAVAPAEEAAARACLLALGYADVEGDRGMARPEDAGPVEVRRARPGAAEAAAPVTRGGATARIPAADARALHWIMHDLIKEGDYWRGRIDLRHLHDLAELAGEGVDWRALRATAANRTARNAVDAQLLTLRHFFAVEIPADCGRSRLVRFQSWRRVFTATHPVAGAPLRLAGNVSWLTRRLSQSDDLAQRGASDLARRLARTIRDPRSKI